MANEYQDILNAAKNLHGSAEQKEEFSKAADFLINSGREPGVIKRRLELLLEGAKGGVWPEGQY